MTVHTDIEWRERRKQSGEMVYWVIAVDPAGRRWGHQVTADLYETRDVDALDALYAHVLAND